MKGNFHCCKRHTALSCVWIASAHLWGARTLLDFTKAWNKREDFVVRGLDFTKVIATAQTDDIDDFGKLVMVAYMGIDDAMGWFHTRDGAL